MDRNTNVIEHPIPSDLIKFKGSRTRPKKQAANVVPDTKMVWPVCNK